MNKIIKWGLIIVIAIIVISAIAGNSKKQSTTQQTSSGSEQSKTEQKQEETAQVAKIGDTVVDKDLAFTVTGVTTTKALGNDFTRKEAQGTFNVITIKIENKAKETKTIDSSMLQITDNQGRKFDRSVDGQTAKGLAQGKVDLFLQQVQPGLSVTGDIVFDLPSDVQEAKLVVKGSLFGSSGKEISLVK